MSQTPDYATWLTKQQAADAIGVTTKTIERLAQDGQVQQARWRRPSGGPELAVYHPADIARVAATRRQANPAPFVVPGTTDLPTNGHGMEPHALTLGSSTGPTSDELLHALTWLMGKVVSETSETATLFLTIPEAAAVTGLTQAYLRRRIADGTLPAIRDRSWRIRRRDLETL